MSESSQKGWPVTVWISVRPAAVAGREASSDTARRGGLAGGGLPATALEDDEDGGRGAVPGDRHPPGLQSRPSCQCADYNVHAPVYHAGRAGQSGQVAHPARTEPTNRPRRQPGVFIPWSVLRVLAILMCAAAASLLIAMEPPQVAEVIGTIAAISATGLAILDALKGHDDGGTQPPGRDLRRHPGLNKDQWRSGVGHRSAGPFS
jgi:hypothetical protein